MPPGEGGTALEYGHQSVSQSQTTDAPGRLKKRDCERCERPKSVCLCSCLPDEPLELAGKVIVLQHPFEQKKRLATVPVLQKCVAGVEVLRSRSYRPAHPPHEPLRAALQGAAEGRYPLLVLFPGAGARDVRDVGAELRGDGAAGASGAPQPASAHQAAQKDAPRQRQQQQQGTQEQQQEEGQEREQEQGTQPLQQQQQGRRQQQQELGGQPAPKQAFLAGDKDPLYVMLVIDGTWKQAKEMFKAVLPLVLQPGGPGVRVQLPAPSRDPQHQRQRQQPEASGAAAAEDAASAEASVDAGAAAAAAGSAASSGAAGLPPEAAADGPLLIRVEPMEGCLTTCEAAARALGCLEPRGGAVREAILRPLAQLARYQAQWDPSMAARLAAASAGYTRSRNRMGMGRQGILEAIP